MSNKRAYKSGISAWQISERPRERLLANGSHALTDAELLAILLRIGVKGKSAVELGRELLEIFGSLPAMMSAPLSAWDGIKGIGSAKKAQLIAALELGRRAALPAEEDRMRMKSTSDAAKYFSARLRSLADEHFRVVYLNRQGRMLDDALIATGVVDIVRPSVRKIVSRALQLNASALILAHNHPSGKAEPSDSDRDLTRNLIAACHPSGVKILEHVIVAGNETFSFADSGLLDTLALETITPFPVK